MLRLALTFRITVFKKTVQPLYLSITTRHKVLLYATTDRLLKSNLEERLEARILLELAKVALDLYLKCIKGTLNRIEIR